MYDLHFTTLLEQVYHKKQAMLFERKDSSLSSSLLLCQIFCCLFVPICDVKCILVFATEIVEAISIIFHTTLFDILTRIVWSHAKVNLKLNRFISNFQSTYLVKLILIYVNLYYFKNRCIMFLFASIGLRNKRMNGYIDIIQTTERNVSSNLHSFRTIIKSYIHITILC